VDVPSLPPTPVLVALDGLPRPEEYDDPIGGLNFLRTAYPLPLLKPGDSRPLFSFSSLGLADIKLLGLVLSNREPI
jgi:hypothetical protein